MMRQNIPSRELNMKRMVDIVRIGHDTLDDEHTNLMTAIEEIITFQMIASNLDVDNPKVFQYEEKNQYMIEPHLNTISSAMASIEPIVNFSKSQMYLLELRAQGRIPEMELTPSGEGSETKDIKEKDSRSIKEKLFGASKRRIVTKTDPYQHSIDYLTDTMKKIPRIELFMEYQAYGVDLARYATFKGMLSYLRFHRNRFKYEMRPALIRAHKMYIELVKADERRGAIEVATSQSKEIFQTRNDFNPSMMMKGGGQI